MRELDALISEFSHEKQRSREKDALLTLRKVASLVKPIMRARSWRVGTLAEFYPAEQNLLGVNWNKGEKICLRLRYPGDANQFLPLEQVVDTMLHELSHNVFNEHDAKFHALWDQLREEYEGLIRKGYTGEGFLSDGKRLGGKRVPRDEARRIARNAAEKRRTLYSGSGQKLGGAPLRPGEDIRRVIVEAIDRRARVLKGCGSGEKDAKEIKAITDQAMSTGFKTKAEEDEANDQAIAQALWEMVQEEEREKYGDAYIPPSAANPTGNGGRDVASAVQPLAKTTPTTTSTAKSSTLTRPTSSQPRHVSRLVAQPPPNARSSTRPSDRPTVSQKPSLQAAAQPSKVIPEEMWECEVCTCHNPMTYLCCDACGTERSVDFHGEVPGASATCSRTLPNPLTSSTTWTCHKCSTVMENQWWTCSTCSSMKLSS